MKKNQIFEFLKYLALTTKFLFTLFRDLVVSLCVSYKNNYFNPLYNNNDDDLILYIIINFL